MGKRVLVVGGVAGGASVAARVRRLDADACITIFEKGEHVSFSNCALPYYLSRTVEDKDNLTLMTPEDFKTCLLYTSKMCIRDRFQVAVQLLGGIGIVYGKQIAGSAVVPVVHVLASL